MQTPDRSSPLNYSTTAMRASNTPDTSRAIINNEASGSALRDGGGAPSNIDINDHAVDEDAEELERDDEESVNVSRQPPSFESILQVYESVPTGGFVVEYQDMEKNTGLAANSMLVSMMASAAPIVKDMEAGAAFKLAVVDIMEVAKKCAESILEQYKEVSGALFYICMVWIRIYVEPEISWEEFEDYVKKQYTMAYPPKEGVSAPEVKKGRKAATGTTLDTVARSVKNAVNHVEAIIDKLQMFSDCKLYVERLESMKNKFEKISFIMEKCAMRFHQLLVEVFSARCDGKYDRIPKFDKFGKSHMVDTLKWLNKFITIHVSDAGKGKSAKGKKGLAGTKNQIISFLGAQNTDFFLTSVEVAKKRNAVKNSFIVGVSDDDKSEMEEEKLQVKKKKKVQPTVSEEAEVFVLNIKGRDVRVQVMDGMEALANFQKDEDGRIVID
ncbi:hypothetical protein BCR33DRAFT_799213 [Rhizoclosmatium globosum]|uniref:Uncharacterized protein n=1 Tax=Rhizoclosmatium globosum TaxID=329046 RepID=A0A1Y2ABQ5_9FUNG|nr:hypothetical protein BCR33DRAFT_799213 [Rhizoclosmatium globosum]|eukprot:ORY19914.1 hypothetical protein BCR33DRAFT_799213 [Rhizoclosmatium globosum]